MDSNFLYQNMNIIDQNQKIFKEPLSINDFEIIKTLGKRNCVEVYQVKYNGNQKIYALKKTDHKFFKGANSKESENEIDYLREKTILYDLTNRNFPNSPKLYTDFEDDEYRYLVSEYCEGTKLKDLKGNYNQNGYISEELVINILSQLLKALKFLHETCKIINRNIKSDNIIIDKNDNIKLLDFGLSVYLEDHNPRLISRRSIKGTIDFAPDEIILASGARNYDYKIDIFSLGYTIYSLMNPSNNNSINLPKITYRTSNGYERIQNNIPPLMNNFYSKGLIELIKSLYNSDPTLRPTAGEALAQLENLQSYTAIKCENINNRINNNNIIEENQNIIQLNNYSNNNVNIPRSNINNSYNQANFNPILKEPLNNNFKRGNTFDKKPIEINQDNLRRLLDLLKCLLRIFYRINLKQYIYQQILPKNNFAYVFSFYDLLDKMEQLDNQRITSEYYDQLVNNFIFQTLYNNYDIKLYDISPKDLYYMLISLFMKEFQNYMENSNQNIFSEDIIQDNLLSMNDPQVFNKIFAAVSKFGGDAKDFFIYKFNFLEFVVKKCAKCCTNFLERKIKRVSSLIFKDPNQPIDFSELIKYYFKEKEGYSNFQCQICGPCNKKFRTYYCVTLPEYLILDFIDGKNVININYNYIAIPSYNEAEVCYQFIACIYKNQNYNGNDFTVAIKNGNQYEIFPPNNNNNLGNPSLALYKRCC